MCRKMPHCHEKVNAPNQKGTHAPLVVRERKNIYCEKRPMRKEEKKGMLHFLFLYVRR